MADVGSVSSAGSAITASILRSADDNTAVAATLLKKATDADRDLVNTLLPAAGTTSGVDIKA